MSLTSGTRLGPYEIIALVGQGGMGSVYRAKDTRLDRAVAIKTLATQFTDNSELKQRFEREARAISSIAHPHICTLHDVGEHEGTEFLVMEFLEGETLADRLRRGPMPIDQVLRYGVEIASALDHAHRHGIVHRDLKPGNVMITKSGAKLLDFGLAKSVAPQISSQSSNDLPSRDDRPAEAVGSQLGLTEVKALTEQGTILGTFQYMAPEQLEGVPADGRTDIFAFGVLLYEMATGRKAFEGKSRASLIASILDRDPPPISTVQPLSPPALDRVIATCLQKNPDDRWQTAHDLVLQLKWLAEGGSQAGVAAPVLARRKQREWTAWILAALATTAAMVFGAFLMRDRMAPKPRPVVSSINPPEDVWFSKNEAPLISPDGSRVAFIGWGRDTSRIYVRDLAKEEAESIAGSDLAEVMFWAPDSRHIGFFTDSHLKRVAVAGGPPQTLCAVRQPRGGAWAPDGTIIFGAYREPLSKIGSNGGTPSPLTKLAAGELNHRWPIVLPGGKNVVFLVQRAEGGAPDDPSTLDVVSLDTGTRKQLVRANSSPLYARSGHLLFWREQTLFAQPFDAKKLEMTGEPFAAVSDVAYSGNERAFASISDGNTLVYVRGGSLRNSRLVWYDRSGKEISQEGELAPYSAPLISPDGSKVVFELNEGTNDIWIRDLVRKTITRATIDPGDEYAPVWSPDGKRIAYASGGLPLAIWISPAGGGNSERVWEGGNPNPSDWSRNDEILVEFLETKSGWGIGLLSVRDRRFRPLIQTPFYDSSPRFSPDGKWVTYASDQSKRFEVYAQSLESGERFQISTLGGGWPIWSRDGSEIYFLSPDDKLMAVPVRTTPQFEAGTPAVLFQTRAVGGRPYDVASRDRFLVNTNPDNDRSIAVTLVQNWSASKP